MNNISKNNEPGTSVITDMDKSHNKETEGSSIRTLEPYSVKSNKGKKRQGFKPNPALIHFENLFGLDNWSRFLVLKSDQNISSARLENTLLSKCPTKEMTFRMMKTNEWLVETTTKNQSEIYQNIKEISGAKVSVTKHDTLNYIQGTVILPQTDCDEGMPDKSVLLESLQLRYNNIHDLELYEIKNRKSNSMLKVAKIKFTGQTLPLKIKIMGQNREVRPYIPKPLQCNKCCKFGHTHKKCHNNEVCNVCGSDHPTD